MHTSAAYGIPIATFVAVLLIGADAYMGKEYDFLVKDPPKNISCFDCNSYTFNTTADREKFSLMNQYCERDPGRVKHFKKRCTSKAAVGCAVIRTRYTQYAHNVRDRVTYHVNRFCVDRLLSKCEVSESSRGYITLCTCDSDYCNSVTPLIPMNNFGLIVLVLSAIVAIRT